MQESEIDPYKVPAGRELDALIHYRVLKRALSDAAPCYSTEPNATEALKKEMEKEYGIHITAGTTNIVATRWFARYEIEPGNPTEVLAETYPLAVCRLSLLCASKS